MTTNPIQHRRPQLVALCRRHHVRTLELFGSGAGERFDPARSDLDFLVEFEELDPGACADAYFGLLEDLETLFGRPVDLVMTSAITNPHFLQGIADSRAVLYASEG